MNNELNIKLFEHVFIPIHGGISSKGTVKLLNGSKHSLIEVFLRESVQNSWDAKIPIEESIFFTLNGYYFEDSQRDFLNNLLINAGTFGVNTANRITSKCFNIEVGDSNTTGLTGSCRPAANSNAEEKFSNFVYMTGNDGMKSDSSGGSYGFGKSALYKVSTIRFLAVYTRIQYPVTMRFETRFILTRNDETIPTSSDRCWWGKREHTEKKGETALPFLNAEADYIAEKLGMSLFSGEETGTRLLIIAAKSEETDDCNESIENIFKEQLPVYITHWFWTKQISKQILFKIIFCGKNISDSIPEPDTIHPYLDFSRAFRNYRKCIIDHQKNVNPNSIKTIKCSRPDVILGHLSLVTSEWDKNAYPFIKIDWKKPTIAFMRNIEFIVDYKPYSFDNNEKRQSCFGVFHVDPKEHTRTGEKGEIDQYFRIVENQSHDCWVHSSSAGKYNYVNSIEKEIPEKIKEFLGIYEKLGNSGTISAIIAKKFGEKLTFGFGSGASPSFENTDDIKSTPKKSTFRRTNFPSKIDFVNGKKYIYIECKADIIKNDSLLVSVDCGIKTIDHSDRLLVEYSKLRVFRIETTTANGDKSSFIKMPIKISKSAIYTVIVEATGNCSFELIIDTEVKNV